MLSCTVIANRAQLEGLLPGERELLERLDYLWFLGPGGQRAGAARLRAPPNG